MIEERELPDDHFLDKMTGKDLKVCVVFLSVNEMMRNISPPTSPSVNPPSNKIMSVPQVHDGHLVTYFGQRCQTDNVNVRHVSKLNFNLRRKR